MPLDASRPSGDSRSQALNKAGTELVALNYLEASPARLLPRVFYISIHVEFSGYPAAGRRVGRQTDCLDSES